MSDRARRVGSNEALFRNVNEEVRNLNDTFSVPVARMTAICECGSQECLEKIKILPAAYEALRADATLFAIKPGHEIPDVETVVERGENYWIVKKHKGIPAEVARETDPRH